MKNHEILRSYGTDYKEMTKRLLLAADLAGEIGETDRLVSIKPNLVSPTPASFGATTHPEIVAGIIEYLQENGFRRLQILEGSWVGDKTEESFQMCGYTELSARYDVPLIDTQKEKAAETDCAGEPLCICQSALDAGFLINVPVLKGHGQTKITCALKNMKGLIPNTEKRRFHTMGLHRPIAHLNARLHQDFIVIDHICGDPYSEDGGTPLVRNCIMAAKDPVLTDAYVCSLLGFLPSEVEYLMLSEQLGIGCADLNKLELLTVEGSAEEDLPLLTRKASVLSNVHEVDSCSACYQMLSQALLQLKEEGLLSKLNQTVCIGQGFREKTGALGVGTCTKQFQHSVPGCPPDADTIYQFLKQYIEGTI